jgi:hypothetical protein
MATGLERELEYKTVDSEIAAESIGDAKPFALEKTEGNWLIGAKCQRDFKFMIDPQWLSSGTFKFEVV